MALEIGALVLMLAALAAAGMVYASDRRAAKLEAVRLQKMRNSSMYQELYDVVHRMRRRYVEQVRIRRECVEFRMMVPAGRRVVFILANRGFHPLSPARQRTLSLLLAQEIPVLADKNRYALRKEKRLLPNGERDAEYVYTMRIGYKDALNRAPYYTQG